MVGALPEMAGGTFVVKGVHLILSRLDFEMPIRYPGRR